MVNRESAEKEFRILFEAAPIGIIAVNAAGLITIANSRALQTFGYSHHELIGQSIQVLVPERFRRRHDRLREHFGVAPHMREMGVGRELFGVRKDGSEFPVEIALNHIAAGTEAVTVAAVADITERKRTNEQGALLEQARGNVDLCQQLGLPAAVLRPDGRVLFSNSLLQELRPQLVPKADRIELAAKSAQKFLTQALADLESRKNYGVRHFFVPADNGHQASIIRLVRIGGATATESLRSTPALGILIMATVGAKQCASADLLRSLFALTSAEARIATLIGSGHSLEQVAGELGISKETARSALKNVFTKLNVSRQSELAALLARLVI